MYIREGISDLRINVTVMSPYPRDRGITMRMVYICHICVNVCAYLCTGCVSYVQCYGHCKPKFLFNEYVMKRIRVYI